MPLHANLIELSFKHFNRCGTSSLINLKYNLLICFYSRSKVLKCIIYTDKLPEAQGEKKLYKGVVLKRLKPHSHEVEWIPWYLLRIFYDAGITDWCVQCLSLFIRRRPRVRELRGHLYAAVAPRRHWSLPVQCLRTLPQDERTKQAAHQAQEAVGK